MQIALTQGRDKAIDIIVALRAEDPLIPRNDLRSELVAVLLLDECFGTPCIPFVYDDIAVTYFPMSSVYSIATVE